MFAGGNCYSNYATTSINIERWSGDRQPNQKLLLLDDPTGCSVVVLQDCWRLFLSCFLFVPAANLAHKWLIIRRPHGQKLNTVLADVKNGF